MPSEKAELRWEVQWAGVIDLLHHQENVFLLQYLPRDRSNIPLTTCHFVGCLNEIGVIEPGSFRLSLEHQSRIDPAKNILEYRPIAQVTEALQLPRTTDSAKRGVGAGGEKWFCLRCVEAATKGAKRRYYANHIREPLPDPPFSPILDIYNYIIPDLRKVPDIPGYLTLPRFMAYAVELWKAVRRCRLKFEASASSKPKTASGLFPDAFWGMDGESIYIEESLVYERGLLPGGSIAELTADDVRDKSLSLILKKASDLMVSVRAVKQATKEARRLEEKQATEGSRTVEYVVEHKGEEKKSEKNLSKGEIEVLRLESTQAPAHSKEEVTPPGSPQDINTPVPNPLQPATYESRPILPATTYRSPSPAPTIQKSKSAAKTASQPAPSFTDHDQATSPVAQDEKSDPPEHTIAHPPGFRPINCTCALPFTLENNNLMPRSFLPVQVPASNVRPQVPTFNAEVRDWVAGRVPVLATMRAEE